MLWTSKMIVFLAITHTALSNNAAKTLSMLTTERTIGRSSVINSYHEFYNSSFVSNKESSATMWQKIPAKQHNFIDTDFFLDCKHTNTLYKLVTLPFDFPFYGHLVRNVAVMMDGYIYLNKISTDSSSVKQYVAPLMAGRFSSNEKSSVRWLLESNSFTVQWENLDSCSQKSYQSGKFSFQATLKADGTIIFFYKEIPIKMWAFADLLPQPMHIGICDQLEPPDKSDFARKIVTKWKHAIDFSDHSKYNFESSSILTLRPNSLCQGYDDCATCISASKILNCAWSPALQQCVFSRPALRAKTGKKLWNKCDKQQTNEIIKKVAKQPEQEEEKTEKSENSTISTPRPSVLKGSAISSWTWHHSLLFVASFLAIVFGVLAILVRRLIKWRFDFVL